MQQYVYLNRKGEFLAWEELKKESSGRVHTFHWVSSIDEAKLCSLSEYSNMVWNGDTPFVVAHIPARETRKVELVLKAERK